MKKIECKGVGDNDGFFELEVSSKDLLTKIRNDAFMNSIYQIANNQGMSEVEMLSKAVVMLLDLKEEAFQEKIDKAMRSPAPLIALSQEYQEYIKRDGIK